MRGVRGVRSGGGGVGLFFVTVNFLEAAVGKEREGEQDELDGAKQDLQAHPNDCPVVRRETGGQVDVQHRDVQPLPRQLPLVEPPARNHDVIRTEDDVTTSQLAVFRRRREGGSRDSGAHAG